MSKKLAALFLAALMLISCLPALADGSVIKIWPDSGCDHGTVRKGKCEWA